MFSHFRFWISLWLPPQPDAISSSMPQQLCQRGSGRVASCEGKQGSGSAKWDRHGLCHPSGYIEGWGVTTGSTLTSWYYLMPNVFRVAESSSSVPAWGAQSANVGEQCMLPTMPLHGSSWWTEMIGEHRWTMDFLWFLEGKSLPLRIASHRWFRRSLSRLRLSNPRLHILSKRAVLKVRGDGFKMFQAMHSSSLFYIFLYSSWILTILTKVSNAVSALKYNQQSSHHKIVCVCGRVMRYKCSATQSLLQLMSIHK